MKYLILPRMKQLLYDWAAHNSHPHRGPNPCSGGTRCFILRRHEPKRFGASGLTGREYRCAGEWRGECVFQVSEREISLFQNIFLYRQRVGVDYPFADNFKKRCWSLVYNFKMLEVIYLMEQKKKCTILPASGNRATGRVAFSHEGKKFVIWKRISATFTDVPFHFYPKNTTKWNTNVKIDESCVQHTYRSQHVTL